MEQAKQSLLALRTTVEDACSRIKLSELTNELLELSSLSTQPSFWEDPQHAQTVSKRIAALEKRTEPWILLRQGIADLLEMLELEDESLLPEINEQLATHQRAVDDLKKELRYSGPYDDHDAILSIYAGAGGTDAQDWAQMLLRMYVRWAEKHSYDTVLIEQSSGEEAGIKSATLEISGAFVFAKLKGEHGVHRLVRLSPFNSDNLRQTSFAKVDVLPKIDQPDELVLDEKELKIDVYRAGGHGGQSVNTTDSAVRVTHIPTGITVSIQNERSQLQNKETAMTILRSRLAQLQMEQHKESLSELKGPNEQAAWGNQIRNYVLHPYKQVKDVRTRHESSDPEAVLDGAIDSFIEAAAEL